MPLGPIYRSTQGGTRFAFNLLVKPSLMSVRISRGRYVGIYHTSHLFGPYQPGYSLRGCRTWVNNSGDALWRAP